MTATFFALARFYIPARAGYSQLAFCHRRFGSESLVGAQGAHPGTLVQCTPSRPHPPGYFCIGFYTRHPSLPSEEARASMFPNSRPQIAGDRLVERQRAKRRLTLTFSQKLDFENPNEQNFILLVVATEEQTEQRLSSSATLRVQVGIRNTFFISILTIGCTGDRPERQPPGL